MEGQISSPSLVLAVQALHWTWSHEAPGVWYSTGPFFCVDGPTLADLVVYDFLESPFPGLEALGVELAEFPKVLAVAEAVAKDPYVESYLMVKSMGKPEFIYFDLAGRDELTRLAFIAGGVDFTDTRHSFDAWPALKGDLESVPAKMFGSMPCIKHGDVMLAQFKATAVYAASLLEFGRKVAWEKPWKRAQQTR